LWQSNLTLGGAGFENSEPCHGRLTQAHLESWAMAKQTSENFFKLFSFLFLAFGISACSTADSSTPAKPLSASEKLEARSINDLTPLMYEMLSEITSLQPYMVNEAKFKDTKNKKDLGARLERLAEISSRVMVHKRTQVQSYRLSGEALNAHIQQLLKVYKGGNPSYARWMLAATPFACASCHTQLPESPKPLWNITADQIEGNPFEKAEFLFATRNYPEALDIYRTLGRAGAGLEGAELEKTYHHKLTILVRLNRDLAATEKELSDDLEKGQNLPGFLKKNIEGWRRQAGILKKDSYFNLKKAAPLKKTLATSAKLLEGRPRGFVASSNPDLVKFLYLSGQLYEALQNEPASSPKIPEILYYLGLVDMGLNHEFFFSLGHLYLKECFQQNPKSPWAKRCYGEYRAEMENLYTGSRGVDLPPEVAEELEAAKIQLGL
jgi:hypothetical protein